jgi:hypothetical protein
MFLYKYTCLRIFAHISRKLRVGPIKLWTKLQGFLYMGGVRVDYLYPQDPI